MQRTPQNEYLFDDVALQDFMTKELFEKELSKIRIGSDRDPSLQNSSGLVNTIGMRENSELVVPRGNNLTKLNPPARTGLGLNSVSHKREDTLGDEDFNINTESGSGSKGEGRSRDSPIRQEDLTIDMLQSKNHDAMREKQRLMMIREAAGPSQVPRTVNMLQNPQKFNDMCEVELGASAFQGNSGMGEIGDDGLSVEQLKRNNQQLQQIMMQLQTTPNFTPNAHESAASAKQFSALDSSYQAPSQFNIPGFPPHLVGQMGPPKIVESVPRQASAGFQNPGAWGGPNNQFQNNLPQTVDYIKVAPSHSIQIQNQEPPQLAKIDMLQQAIASQQNMHLPQHPGHPQNAQYRQMFKPSAPLMTAAHTMLESKENQMFHMNAPPSHHHQQHQQQQHFSSGFPQEHGHTSKSAFAKPGQEMPVDMAQLNSRQFVQPQTSMQLAQNGQPQRSGSTGSGQQPQAQMQSHSLNSVSKKHSEIMKHFDDIPISKIQKMPGYQTGPELAQSLQEDNPNATEDTYRGRDDRDLAERAIDPAWKVRFDAYKEIHQLFQESSNSEENYFELYGPLLQGMIQDTNLTAAFEGMQCTYLYVKTASDIKAVTFAIHILLLDKVQTNKTNFKEVNTKILLEMLKRDQGLTVYPELVKRVAVKDRNNTRTSAFASHVLIEAFKEEAQVEEINLKALFRQLQENLSHQNKELRELAVGLLQNVYQNCGDSVEVFLNNCKKLRPVQVKELKDLLSKLEKRSAVKLFDENDVPELHPTPSTREAKDAEGSKFHHTAHSAFEPPTRDVGHLEQTTAEPVDLLTLVPDGFADIPYETSINKKRKIMETFNGELARLVSESRGKGVPVKNKDYTMLFNTVVHMLEDKNMLVFVEGIRTVELLAKILGPHGMMKAGKVKMFISLLAGKFGETKTAVIAAVDKGMEAIAMYSLSATQFLDTCLNQVAFPHKNPRVKQFVIEHTLDQLFRRIQGDKEQVGAAFKVIKEKMVQLILKDTSASVRDASVALLGLVKQILPDHPLVEEAIKALPKYRITEIQKRLGADQTTDANDSAVIVPPKAVNPTAATTTAKSQKNSEVDPFQQELVEVVPSASEQDQKPAFAKSFSDRIKSAKGTRPQPSANPQTQEQLALIQERAEFVESALDGKPLPEEFRPRVVEILVDLAHIRLGKISLDLKQLQAKWDSLLGQLGEQGLYESKRVLTKGIYLVLTYPGVALEESQGYLRCMLALSKRIYAAAPTIERDDNGTSVELKEFLVVALLQNSWLVNNQGETCNMLQVGLTATGNAFDFIDHLRSVLDKPIIYQSKAALQIIEAVYVWLGIRLQDFIAAGMEITDLEELRGIGLKFLNSSGFSEAQRQALIQIMMKFKDLVEYKRQEAASRPQSAYKHSQKDHESQASSRLQTPQMNSQPLQLSQATQPQTAKFASLPESHRGPLHGQAEVICKLIDSEFEKGLLLFKELAQQQNLDFETKEQIFDKLLGIVGEGYKQQPQQQYKQAYSLKALMWMKEETLGVEDCYKLTSKIMHVLAKVDADEGDSTVELYLLNFWTKDLSVRDIADRISLTVHIWDGESQARSTGYSVGMAANASSEQLVAFNALLKWYSNKFLFCEKAQEDWSLTDLRKVAVFLTLAVLNTKITSPLGHFARDFMGLLIGKFGEVRVKEFMEIQLMHHNELSLKLIDWIEAKKPRSRAGDEVQEKVEQRSTGKKHVLPVMQLENLAADDYTGTKHPVRERTISGNSGKDSGRKSGHTPRTMLAASQSYKERRDQYKQSTKKASEEDANSVHSDSYVSLIQRIESNLQIVQKETSRSGSAAAKQTRDQQIIDETSGESGGEDTLKKVQEFTLSAERRKEAEGQDLEKEYQRIEREYRSRMADEEARHYNESKEDSEDGDKVFRRTNTSAYYRSIEKKRYMPTAEELADDQDIKGNLSDEDDQIVIEKLDERHEHSKQRETPQNIEQIQDRLELSTVKQQHWRDKIQMLEMEKQRIEENNNALMREHDQESAAWKRRQEKMQLEHSQVVQNLATVNSQYSQQLRENEQLKQQLDTMQKQHAEMLSRFEQIEQKINQRSFQSPRPAEKNQLQQSTKKEMVVSIRKIQRIEQTFGDAKQLLDESQTNAGVSLQRIQDLLLNVDKNVEGELSQPLILHYQQLKTFEARYQMVNLLGEALDSNEDVLNALSAEVYKALLNFLLWAFAREKQILESETLPGRGANRQNPDQNEVTMLAQQLVSKLLNSKRFTTSLVALFQLLREAMPKNLEAHLSVEERQYLRVLMRCIQRITKALHSEQPDLVRAFDVLVEMQKMFVQHPPEQLREDLPCLADFDFIYRAMKDVSDKLFELQPDKVESFLDYACGSRQHGDSQPNNNAFIKYLQQMVDSMDNSKYQ